MLALVALGVGAVPTPAAAADEALLERLALCQDSWFDWKTDKTRTAPFVALLKTRFRSDDDGQSYEPAAPMRLFGAPVLQAYPQSIGMGVGFSVLLEIDMAAARKIFEKLLGRPMRCEIGDGMESCEVSIAAERTATLTSNLGPDRRTLAGCYYFYQP